MKSWYKTVDDIQLMGGSIIKRDRLVFLTADKELSKRVEDFFKSLMDEQTEKNGHKVVVADTPQTD